MTRGLLAVLALTTAVAPGHALEMRRNITRQVPMDPDDSLVVRARFSDIEVYPSPDANLYLAVELIAGADTRASAEQCLAQMAVLVEPGDGHILVSTQPESCCCEATRIGFNLVIKAPTQANLAITNSYGNVAVKGRRGAVTVLNRFGATNAQDLTQARISNAFGRVSAAEIRSRTEITSRFGDVTARDIAGTVEIANEAGPVRLAHSHVSARLENQLGEISVIGTTGAVSINSIRGPVHYEQLIPQPDTVTIRSQAGPVHVVLPSEPSAVIRAQAPGGRIVCAVLTDQAGPGHAPLSQPETTLFYGQRAALFDLLTTDAQITIESRP